MYSFNAAGGGTWVPMGGPVTSTATGVGPWMLTPENGRQYRLVEVSAPIGTSPNYFQQTIPGHWTVFFNVHLHIQITRTGGAPNIILQGDDVLIPNRLYPNVNLEFTKTDDAGDPMDGDPLGGATFQLYRRVWDNGDYTWTAITGATSTSNATTGLVSIPLPAPEWHRPDTNLPYPHHPEFKLREVSAPDGFLTPPGHWIVTPVFDYVLQRVNFTMERVLGPDEDPTNPITPEFEGTFTVGATGLMEATSFAQAYQAETSLYVGNTPGRDFLFHKTDDRMQEQFGPGITTCWDTVHSYLLPGAHFAMYSFNGPGSPPAGSLVSSATIGTGPGQWTLVGNITSAAPPTPTSSPMPPPMSIPLRQAHPTTYFQLKELAAPSGFTTPHGQWRIVLSGNQTAGFTTTVTTIGNAPGFELNPTTGIRYVSNWTELRLPLTGGAGTVMFTIIGVAIVGFAVVMLLVTRRKGSVRGKGRYHRH